MEIYEAERVWGEALSRQSLVVQVEYEDELARSALKRIGYLIQRGDNHAVETGLLASLLVGLNLIASAELAQGALWSQIMRSLNDLDNTQGNQARIARLHRLALNKFGLQRFEHPLGRIGEIILHSGIPVHSQKSFVKRLINDYRDIPNFDAEYFNDEIRSLPRERVQSRGLDAPTWHFINQAGGVADDFVAKCISVLDDLQDDGLLNNGGGDGLPPRVIDEIVRVVGELGKVQRTKGNGRIAAPKLFWRTDDSSQLQVSLPVMPEHYSSETSWAIESQERQDTLTIGRSTHGLEPTRGEADIRYVTAAISLKATLGVTYSWPMTRSWNLRLFDEATPALIFNSAGQLDNQRGPLEPALHRILVPRRYKEKESEVFVDGVLVKRRVDAPFGWGSDSDGVDWVAFEVDLSAVEELSIFLGSSAKAALKRSVSIYKKPKLGEQYAIPGLFDAAGNQVHSALPEVFVPPSQNEDDYWTYTVEDFETQTVRSQQIVPVKGLVRPTMPEDLDGSYEVNVSRGFGTGLRMTVNVVSGLQRTDADAIRPMSDEGFGLEAIDIELSKLGTVGRFSLKRSELSALLEDQNLSSQSLTLKPKYEQLELLNTKSLKSSPWMTPTLTHIEDLDDLQIFASIKNPSGAKLVGLWPDSVLVELAPKETSPRLRFNLAEFSETARQKGAFQILLVTNTGRKLEAGQSFPRRMFESGSYNEGTKTLDLIFRSSQPPTNLEICLYATTAPWLKPEVFKISGNSIAVPEVMVGMGKIHFTLALSNPWVTSAFQDTPDTSSPNTAEFDGGAPDPEFSPDHALSNWLATGIRHPNVRGISVDRAWQCMLMAEIQSGSLVNRRAVRDFAADILGGNSQEALAKYPVSLRSDEHYLKHLFITGLVAAQSAEVTAGVDEFAAKPFLACLLASGINRDREEQLFDLSRSFWGLKDAAPEGEQEDTPLLALLLKKAFLFSALPPLFSAYDDDQLTAWADTHVPGALFEGGTMAKIVQTLAIGSDQVLEQVEVPQIARLRADLELFQDSLPASFQALSEARPFAADALRASVRNTRGTRISSLDLPAASIRLALLARLSARGEPTALQLWAKHQFTYRQISTAAPLLVEIDLTIAELYIRLFEKAQI